MVPEIAMAVALISSFRASRLDGIFRLGYLIAAHTVFDIPFADMPIRARLETAWI